MGKNYNEYTHIYNDKEYKFMIGDVLNLSFYKKEVIFLYDIEYKYGGYSNIPKSYLLSLHQKCCAIDKDITLDWEIIEIVYKEFISVFGSWYDYEIRLKETQTGLVIKLFADNLISKIYKFTPKKDYGFKLMQQKSAEKYWESRKYFIYPSYNYINKSSIVLIDDFDKKCKFYSIFCHRTQKKYTTRKNPEFVFETLADAINGAKTLFPNISCIREYDFECKCNEYARNLYLKDKIKIETPLYDYYK